MRAWEQQAAAAITAQDLDFSLPPPMPPPLNPLLDRVVNICKNLSSKFVFSDEEHEVLSQLSLDTWDSPDFFLYPVMVLFPRKGGPDAAWTRLCLSDKMLVGCTDDGWMDGVKKLQWYDAAGGFPHSPFSDKARCIIDQRDQHVRLLAALERLLAARRLCSPCDTH